MKYINNCTLGKRFAIYDHNSKKYIRMYFRICKLITYDTLYMMAQKLFVNIKKVNRVIFMLAILMALMIIAKKLGTMITKWH